jgi:ribosomal protein S18 acetylase RimI-like enzyme
MSMYGDYILEHRGDGIIEREEGFATYRFINTDQIYIVDIYVKKEFRNTNVASEMANEIVEIGKKRGAKELIGSVVPSANNSTISVKVLLGYGMRLSSSINDFILFKKEI